MPKNIAADPPIKATHLTLRILETLMELESAGVTEIATQLDLPKSTVHDHLRTLEQNSYVVSDEGTYKIGAKFLTLGGFARSRMKLYNIAKPELDKLARETGEHVNLMIEQHGRGVFLYISTGEDALSLDTYVGKRTYLHTTALGKAILANLPQERYEEIIDEHGLERITDQTITTRDRLDAALEEIRAQGYAVDDGERIEGVQCIAAPVVGNNNQVLGALSVSAPKSRMEQRVEEQNIPDQIKRVANVIEVNATYS